MLRSDVFVWRRSADVDGAIALLRRLFELAEGHGDAGTALEAAREFDRLLNEAGALERLAMLVELQPEAAAHRAERAELTARLGRHDRLAEVLAAAATRHAPAQTFVSGARSPACILALCASTAATSRQGPRARQGEDASASLAQRYGIDPERFRDRVLEGDRGLVPAAGAHVVHRNGEPY